MLKDELARLAKDYKNLYDKVDGFCGVGHVRGKAYIQLLESVFDKMFSDETVEYCGDVENDSYEKRVKYSEVIFLCLIEKEEYEEHCNEEV
mgnify:CR=1 FL=1